MENRKATTATANTTFHALTWEDGDVPVSALFGDTFYSRNNGQAEAAYVFLDGNGLPERWTHVERVSIGELGFGTGLSFLETWRQWIAHREPGQRLVFTSFERHPLTPDAMARALRPWETLTPLAGALVTRWFDCKGPAGRWQMDDQTELHVIAGNAEGTVGEWNGMADTWYLDGFSPAKNPDMWSAELMRHVFAHTVPGGRLATYTAAGWVRRNLEAAGFDVGKRIGHGVKREMTIGSKLDTSPDT